MQLYGLNIGSKYRMSSSSVIPCLVSLQVNRGGVADTSRRAGQPGTQGEMAAGRLSGWMVVRLEGCWAGRLTGWKVVGLEYCWAGRLLGAGRLRD